MKKIAFTIFASLFLLTGCNELELDDYTIISPNNFLKTADDAKALVTSCYYDIMHNGDGGMYCFSAFSFPLVTDLSTNVMRCNWGNGTSDWAVQFRQSYTPESPGFTRNLWAYYRNLSKYTLDIDRINGINDASLTDDLKTRYVAEIKAIRAWTAYLLYNTFGTFPIATLEQLKNPLDEVLLERASNETVETLITDDLNDAISALPVSYPDADYGRITKGHALMILLKFQMFKKQWTDASNTARQIIALNKYGLMNSYKDIFSKANRRNTELIYSIPASQVTGANYWLSWTLPYNFPTTNPTISKWNGYRITWDFYDTFEVADERLETIFAEYTSTSGDLITKSNDPDGIFNWGPIPMKYGEDPDVNGHQSTIDYIVFRYSDVLLSLAEAINNTAGPTSEAIGLVNQIRNRVGLPDLASEKTANMASFNDAILNERMHELYCEGFSREDLIRHGKLVETLKQLSGTDMVSEDRSLYPIPQSDITASKGAIKQNPGY
ncbi:RagB/SusD family nutrient uptake outer membrane protein [Mariniflexile sp. HMF6888]|uniref:RagB/SusD family nutrient uptake outer membrane protein n=1 Tax=Mariniflexile sp. HMF6888 TaxID=3373086 RepID=UPI0037A94D7C